MKDELPSLESCPPRADLDAKVVWPSAHARQWARAAVGRWCAAPDVWAVVFFGSSVRGIHTPGDLDILVVNSGTPVGDGRPPMDVDVRQFARDKIAIMVSEGHDLLLWAIKFGLLVCERDKFWSGFRSEWLPKLPLPSADVALSRATKAAALLKNLEEAGDVDAADDLRISWLTHRARAALLQQKIFPESRPELPRQLREAGCPHLANELDAALRERRKRAEGHQRPDLG